MTKIVICGGHLSCALAIIEELLGNKNYQLIYCGRKGALEGDNAESLEYLTITKLGIPFKSITAGRLQRTFTLYTLPSLLKFPVGILQSFLLLLQVRPKLILSFGGYVALPVSLAGWVLQIPIITHEQTHYLGLSNKIISRFARMLCLSYKDTEGIPPRVKTLLTGNPIRKSLFISGDEKIVDFGDKKLPLIYVTGGNLGSRTINETVGKILDVISSKSRILHQCGNAQKEKDFKYLSQLRQSLPSNQVQNYTVVKQLDPSTIGSVYKNSSILVGRAGANTVNEILAFGLPSILIPLPWAGQNEQEKNAYRVESARLGEVILQKDLTPQLLLDKINHMIKNISFYKNNSKKLSKNDGVKSIVKLIDTYCSLYK